MRITRTAPPLQRTCETAHDPAQEGEDAYHRGLSKWANPYGYVGDDADTWAEAWDTAHDNHH